MDLKPCNSAVVYLGQSMLCFSVPSQCNAPSNTTVLRVSRGSVLFAEYPVHGIDAQGMCFYIDDTINAAEGNYTYQIISCGSVMSKGTLVVMQGSVPYRAKSPTTQCKCEGS